MRKSWIAAAALAVLGGGALTYVLAVTVPPPAVPVVGIDVPTVFGRGVIDVDGGIIQVAASREGLITEIHVEEGASVKKGDLLLVIDDRLPRAALGVAHAELAQAEAARTSVQLRMAASKREVARLAPLEGRRHAKAYLRSGNRCNAACRG